MDKSWTKITNKVDRKFMQGAIDFAEMAKGYVDNKGHTHCPCKSCLNVLKQPPHLVSHHIINNGFQQSYEKWTFHGERRSANETDDEGDETEDDSDDGVNDLLGDAFPTEPQTTDVNDEGESSNRSTNPNIDKLFADMKKPLFPGCETFSVLGFILRLMHVKVTCKVTNVCMDMILSLLGEAFKDSIIPKTHYEAKKYLQTLGLGYESIHACKNDCALFWRENSELQSCPGCGASRWVDDKAKQKKIPVKVLRYFPITSRLQRLYASRYTAKDMQSLIPGPVSPGKDIDVYLRPLIDELKVLWEKGVETYDAESGRTFNMHATLMWTINDFPAYGYLSGWTTCGYMACPICNKDASSVPIRNKIAYVGGPVQPRWMYQVERHLGHLKKFVRNKARPEGSIAEGFVVEEALTFCSHYLRGVDSRLERRGRNDDVTVDDVRDYKLDIFHLNGRGLGKGETVRISRILLEKAQWFILTNCSEVEPYLKEHLRVLEIDHPTSSDFNKLQQSSFPSWFSSQIRKKYEQNSYGVVEELYALSRGSDDRVISHGGYIVNGVKFLVKSRDDNSKTQNCGVTALGTHNGVEEDYYGYVDEVLDFSFIKGYRVILFKCIWFDTDRRRKHVKFEPHFISVDTTKHAYREDPFVLANQATQVFYIDDPTNDPGWKIIERSTHRHLWDIPENEDAEYVFEHVETLSQTTALVASSCENFEFPREDGEEELVEIVDDEIVLDDLDDFVDDDTLSDEIVEDLPEESLEDVDDSNKTKMALYDESDDEYEDE
ncbi:hypothetical protein LXL04_000296 [Taraxacum kok-saghyz]